jgi:type IV secretory pathway component VirB8
MANDFSNWQRSSSTSKPTAKEPLDVKWRASHASAVREKRNKGDNPYQAEADRDRVIFRWAILLLVIAVIAIYCLFFMNPGK